jgi:hypothetical protein
MSSFDTNFDTDRAMNLPGLLSERKVVTVDMPVVVLVVQTRPRRVP